MDNKEIKDLGKTAPLSGSIFAVTHSEVGEKTHWKRRMVIRVYPLASLLLDVFLVVAIFAIFVIFRNLIIL